MSDILVVLPEGTANTVVVERGITTVLETRTGSTTVLETTHIGPQGISGVTSGLTSSHEAGETLSGHRVVYVEDDKAYYASSSVLTQAHRIAGITIGATMQGAIAVVQRGSSLEEPSWSWQTDTPIWLGENGVLQQVPPVTGFALRVGFALSATKMFIDICEPIILEG